MATTLDNILTKAIELAAADRDAVIKARGVFTGDDGDLVVEAGDLAAPNQIGTEGTDGSIASIGGRDTGGAWKFDFLTASQAVEFNANVSATLAALGDAISPTGSTAGADAIETVLKAIAINMFGGSLKADANFSGDSLGDGVDFRGANSFFVESADPSVAVVGGRDTGGNFRFDFDDASTAQRFLEVAKVVNAWGADFF